jgi:hypothetical protein
MKEIYKEISKLTPKFRTMAYGLNTDENEVNEAVQELMLYLLQANPEVIKKIYDKDGVEGVTKYGAVALRRALTSPRSNYYYKYRKYYEHVQDYSEINLDKSVGRIRCIENIPNEIVDDFQWTNLEKIDTTLQEGFSWYDTKVFQLYYYENNTLDSLAAKTGISRNSLFTTIDKVREQLKQKLSE